jgi:hypothetical protein
MGSWALSSLVSSNVEASGVTWNEAGYLATFSYLVSRNGHANPTRLPGISHYPNGVPGPDTRVFESTIRPDPG